ncbi:MAG TPA: integrase, partial [Lachnospiraceae bacterium]|nr:integrase [Lachnospiraceae bacterium]
MFMGRVIKEKMLERYEAYLKSEEKSKSTIKKYLCDLRKLVDYAGGKEIDKELVLAYKDKLLTQDGYKVSSINSYLAAANSFFEYMGWLDLRVKSYHMQQETFCQENKYLSKEEYYRLVKTAKEMGKVRLAMILQTIC